MLLLSSLPSFLLVACHGARGGGGGGGGGSIIRAVENPRQQRLSTGRTLSRVLRLHRYGTSEDKQTSGPPGQPTTGTVPDDCCLSPIYVERDRRADAAAPRVGCFW